LSIFLLRYLLKASGNRPDIHRGVIVYILLKCLLKAWGDRRKWALISMEDLLFIFLLRYLLKA
jgi:hypothetical protein